MFNNINLFLGYHVIVELIFTFISILTAVYSFKIYKLSQQKKLKIFGIAFLSISLAYLIQSILNFILILNSTNHIHYGSEIIRHYGHETILSTQNIPIFHMIAVYSHMIFLLIGLTTLIYSFINIISAKKYFLIISLAVLTLSLSKNIFFSFYFISTILLICISSHYLFSYLNNKIEKKLVLLIAFTFLAISHLQYIFSIEYSVINHIISHFIELIGYLLILLSLYKINKNA